MLPDSVREAAFFVWERLLNVPYLWGGDDPLAGVDCSGLVLEGLKSVGIVPRESDSTADQLLTVVFKDKPRQMRLQRGMLVFYGTPAHHVEIVWAVIERETLERVTLTIGASGGGSKTVDRAEAVRANAYVKIRRITPNWIAAVDPF